MTKVLVVDDEKEVVELIKFLLEKDGYQVVTAGDGEEAIAQTEKEMPQLIVLDVMMPKKDGYSVQSELAAKEETRSIPIIILTAKGGVKDLFAMATNVVAYMEKPFDPKTLREKVKEVVGAAA